MGTITEQGALGKLKFSQLASPAPGGSFTPSKTSSAPTTTTSTPLTREAIRERALLARTCPSCGGPKYKGSKTCRACYSPNPQTHSTGKVCPRCGGRKAGPASVCKSCHTELLPHAPTLRLTCTHCAKTFERKVHEHEAAIRKYGGLATFCSRECYNIHPKPPTKVKGHCEGCGVPLKGWDQKKYCSHTCYLDTKKARATGTTYNREYSTLKKLLINQKDRACAMCEQKTYRVEVHHIDHDAEHNKIGNLVLLCSRCHKSYHTLAESVQETLKPLFRTKTASL